MAINNRENRKPFFSIVMPTHQRGHLIQKAIESVLKQSFTDWELIIVDDGSEDDTRIIVSAYQDDRIRYQWQKKNGRSAARNRGIKKARGSMLCFLDDDDWYYPGFLQEMHRFIEEKGRDEAIYFCAQDQWNKKSEIVAKSGIWFPGDPVKYLLQSVNNLQAAALSCEILKSFCFDERFELGEDFHLMFQVVLNYPVYYLDRTLVAYQIHPASTMEREFTSHFMEEQSYNRLDVMEDLWQKYKKEIRDGGQYKSFQKKFNKLRYFYSSAWMRQKNYKKALQTIRYVNLVDFRSIYYLLSIHLRLWMRKVSH